MLFRSATKVEARQEGELLVIGHRQNIGQAGTRGAAALTQAIAGNPEPAGGRCRGSSGLDGQSAQDTTGHQGHLADGGFGEGGQPESR